MIRKIALLGMLGLSLNLTGCGKAAEITSECSLAGNGDYKCNFKNKGNAEGSSCFYLTLGAKPEHDGRSKFSSVVARILIPSIALEMIIADQPGGKPLSASDLVMSVKGMKSVSESADRAMGEIKKDFVDSKKTINEYTQKNGMALAQAVLGTEGKGISREICSGLIKAGDVREINGFTTFSSPEQNELTPVSACNNSYFPSWTDICSFTAISSDELDKYIKSKIESAKIEAAQSK